MPQSSNSLDHRPFPRLTKWISRLINDRKWEGIYGDLLELYAENLMHKGAFRAKWIYFFQLFGFMRARFIKVTKTQSNMRAIFNNYLLTAFRSLNRNKTYFLINHLGLVLAVSCSLYAIVFVLDETSFNRHLGQVDQIHRLYKHHYYPPENIDVYTAETSGMMAPTIVDEIPEAVGYSRVLPWWNEINGLVEERRVKIKQAFIVDSTFFDLFDYQLIAGNPKTVLTAPSSVVVTQRLAETLYPNENAVGKTFIGINDASHTITGIVQNPPRQSSFQFDMLLSWSSTTHGPEEMRMNWANNWRTQGIHSYLLLDPETDVEALTVKMEDMMNRHMPERSDRYFLRLQPFSEIYLQSDHIEQTRGQQVGSQRFVFILVFSAVLILLIASINYVNISLSRASQVVKEVGVRKVLGSSTLQIIGRFISETFLSVFSATIVGTLLLWLLIPELNQLTDKNIPIQEIFSPITISITIGYCLIISLLVGLYPAIVMARSNLSSLIHQSKKSAASNWFRKSLLGLQFIISVTLLSGALIIQNQTDYLRQKPLGFDKEHLLVMRTDASVRDNSEVFLNQLRSNTDIESVSMGRTAIGGGSYTATIAVEGREEDLTPRIFGVDPNFFDTYGIHIQQGRSFHYQSTADTVNVLVNQALVDLLGWEQPISKRIQFVNEGPQYLKVIGVVDDFHYYSLSHSKIEPAVFYLNHWNRSNITLKLSGKRLPQTLAFIEQAWNEHTAKTPFEYYFVDEWFDKQYKKETQLLQVAGIYSIISILLCALGLYGLTGLILQSRTKELSIRKVLGADISSILKIINGQFFGIMVASLMIASPITYWLSIKWIKEFAYFELPGIEVFMFSGLMLITISVIIVSVLAFRTARQNPVIALNQE